ncbi:MAG: AAA family ATPase [Candidatus Nitricoxidivorans perseverans]|uniref:AAA family ATPase n=1 Tax=Candidatus Nitricoxidivorans perseverans TaxID=2975601 RepID=A0AA49IXV7_9PROT|nr:MAG: AAA family ATPase [Candidatus Nitricoxidivorans perseverans]
MYLEHFGLSEAPFRITPHTDFFFAGANRGATLDALLYAITHDEGIVKVSGEVGSGKTMLCRVLMERLPAHITIVYLANPSLSRDDILFAIADELDLEIPDNARTSAVLRSLQERLIELYAGGRQVVVLIDEAHAMPSGTLEEIRLLSNLESNRHKLLQLVLFGQPELNDVLARSDMRQLKERITHNFVLEPLVRNDIAQYLDFRMRAAGYRGPEIFNPSAIRQIAAASRGLTRRINILADKALLAAFAESAHQVTPRQARAAIRDSQFGAAARGPSPGWMTIGGGVAAVGIAAASLLVWRSNPEPAPPAPPPVAAPRLPQAVAPPPPALPESPAPATPPHVSEMDGGLGRLTRLRIEETRKWLANAPDDHWFIQLLATSADRAGYAENFIARAIRLSMANPAEAGHIRAYAAKVDEEYRIGVIYGEFASREDAAAAIDRLPKELRGYKPYPRQVIRLR